MNDSLSAFGLEEYRALRATIRERGTTRFFVAIITFVAWALVAALLAWANARPAGSIVSLVVLAAGFEVVFAAHVGVERVGRYLQVRYETSGEGPAWEQTAMRLGALRGAGLSVDPLFTIVFLVAVIANALLLTPLVGLAQGTAISGTFGIETLVSAGLHLIAIGRLWRARRTARSQRARDLALLSRVLGHTPGE